MSKLLLDSGIFSDYMHRRRGIFERVKQLALQGVRIGSCLPVVAEIAFGIELSSSRDRNFQRLIGVLPTLTIWPFDRDSALTYGRIAAELRRSGRPMQVVDMMIGAISMNLGDCKVVTTDSDLEAISGLSVERW